jgi:hypothetical protein
VSGTLGLTTANFGGTVNGYYNAFTVLNSDAKSAGFTLEATTGWSINFLTRYGISYLEIGNTSGTAVTRRWYGVLDILDPTGVLAWASATLSTSASTNDSGISRLGAASLAIGNGTAGNTSGNLSYNRVNLAGADYAGTVTITAAATTQAVTYAANYTGTAAPVVVATPTSDPLALGVPVGYWVTPTGGAGAWTGFTLAIQTALAGNVTFNYCVIGKA